MSSAVSAPGETDVGDEVSWVARVRPERADLREVNFWWTQAFLAVAAATVYVVDLLFHGDGLNGGMHDVVAMLFIVPVMFAAVAFGTHGALLTWAASVILLAPHTILVARFNLEWLGDTGQMTVVLIVGVFLASRVEQERSARLQAESLSTSLRFLNELAAALDRAGSTTALLQVLVDRLSSNLQLECAWARYVPLDQAVPSRVVACPEAGDLALDVEELSSNATQRLAETGRPWLAPSEAGGMVVVALSVEGRFLGGIGARRRTRPLDSDEWRMFTAAAAQVSVVLDNLELHRHQRHLLTSYAHRVTMAQEDERQRIARELHDGPTQALASLCRGLDLIQADSEPSPRSVEMARSLRVVAEEAVADLRRLARDLRPAVLDDLGLQSALEWLVESLGQRSTITTRMETHGRPFRLAKHQELAVFRIVQEALTNAQKHARASYVEVLLDFTPDSLRLRVRDDGVGFDAGAAQRFSEHEGLGILGMRERARLNGGELRVESSPGAGTEVVLVLGAESADAFPGTMTPADQDGRAAETTRRE